MKIENINAKINETRITENTRNMLSFQWSMTTNILEGVSQETKYHCFQCSDIVHHTYSNTKWVLVVKKRKHKNNRRNNKENMEEKTEESQAKPQTEDEGRLYYFEAKLMNKSDDFHNNVVFAYFLDTENKGCKLADLKIPLTNTNIESHRTLGVKIMFEDCQNKKG